MPVPVLTLGLALGACANVEPVGEFGRSAATIAVLPQAGDAWLDSAVASEP